MFKNVHIVGVGAYHPSKNVDNQYFINHFKNYHLESHAEALMKKLGRNTRTFATDGETSLTMAVEAAKIALANSKLSPEDIDMIISVSDTPEYLSPCCALIIKNALRAKNAHGVFDMNANCIGMLTAMDTAVMYLKSDEKFKRILIVGSLLISHQARPDDMVAYGCTGDGAAAVILERKIEAEERGFLGSRMFTDDSYFWSITMPGCGMSKISYADVDPNDRKMIWKPFDFSFLSEKWAELITALLTEHYYKTEDVSYYFMSQFSKTDLELTMKKLGADMDNNTIFIGNKYGYTGCTSPIMALDERLKSAEFNDNELVVFCSVASGYSMEALLYKW